MTAEHTPGADKQELIFALEEAIGLVKIFLVTIFHGTAGWEQYQKSPEMQRLNAVLRKAKGEQS